MILKFFNKKNLLLVFLSIILFQSGFFIISKNLENKNSFFKFDYKLNSNLSFYSYNESIGKKLKKTHNKFLLNFLIKKFDLDENKIKKKHNKFVWYGKKVSVLDENLLFIELNEFLRSRMIDYLKKKISLNSKILSSTKKYNFEENASTIVYETISYEIFLKEIQENENFIKLDNPTLTYQIKKISWKENILVSSLFIFIILILLKNKKIFFKYQIFSK